MGQSSRAKATNRGLELVHCTGLHSSTDCRPYPAAEYGNHDVTVFDPCLRIDQKQLDWSPGSIRNNWTGPPAIAGATLTSQRNHSKGSESVDSAATTSAAATLSSSTSPGDMITTRVACTKDYLPDRREQAATAQPHLFLRVRGSGYPMSGSIHLNLA